MSCCKSNHRIVNISSPAIINRRFSCKITFVLHKISQSHEHLTSKLVTQQAYVVLWLLIENSLCYICWQSTFLVENAVHENEWLRKFEKKSGKLKLHDPSTLTAAILTLIGSQALTRRTTLHVSFGDFFWNKIKTHLYIVRDNLNLRHICIDIYFWNCKILYNLNMLNTSFCM